MEVYENKIGKMPDRSITFKENGVYLLTGGTGGLGLELSKHIASKEKVKLIDTLDREEKECLLKMIDIAIAKKRIKDNLATMMSEE